MPLDRFTIYCRPEVDLYFVKQETDQASIWYGPVPGDPIEKLDLEPLLLERMKRFETAGNARISIARMACCGHAKLAATGVRLMRQMLTDKDTLNGIDKRSHSAHQAERNLDFVLTILRAHGAALRESEIEGVAELERAAMDMEARFAEAMPSVSDESYNEAGYLQKDLPSDESIRWGPANNGLRLGLVLKTPVVLTQDAEPHSVKLIVQNVSDRTIRFHVEGYIAEWVRVDVTRPDGTRVRTEDGDIGVDIPAFPNPWRLEPGEKYELCENRLTVASPDAKVKASGMRGMRSVVTRLRTTPGRFTAKCIAPLNWRRVVRGKGEWSGELTSSSFDIEVVPADDDKDAGDEADDAVSIDTSTPRDSTTAPGVRWPERMSGNVTNDDGQPLAGADVKLTLFEHFRAGTNSAERILKTARTTVNEDGKYTFETAGLPKPTAQRPFSLEVLVSAAGYAPWESWGFFGAGTRKVPGNLPNVQLPRGRVITGECVDTQGNPVVGAVIRGLSACRNRGMWQRQHAPTDRNGRFQVIAPDGHDAALWCISSSDGCERVDIPAGHRGPFRVVMRGGTSLVGTVESLTGEPVAETLVVLECVERGVKGGRHSMGLRFAAKTDEQGQFRLPPVRGKFACFLAGASTSNELPRYQSIFAERPAPPFAPIVVSLEGETREKTVTLRESRSVDLGGIVRFDDGRLAKGCFVDVFYCFEPKMFRSGVTLGVPVSDDDGRYSLKVPVTENLVIVDALGIPMGDHHHAKPSQHAPGEHQDSSIRLQSLTEDIADADFVLVSSANTD